MPLKTSPKEPGENIKHFISQLDQVRPYQPDLICLPECSFTGYLYEEDDLKRFAEPIPGPLTAQMSALAQAHNVYLCFGMLEAAAEGVYDTAVLLNRHGAIAGVHRKLSEKPPFINGTAMSCFETEFGKLGLLICADLFNDEVVARLDPALRLLLVPTARSFDGQSPDPPRWEREERQVYLEAVRQAGVPAAITNTLETGPQASLFGGALVVSAQGKLLAESPHGTDENLIYNLE